MRKIISLLLVIISWSAVYGQKARMEKIYVKQNHIPINPLNVKTKTFTVDFINHCEKKINFNETTLEIKGFERQSKKEAEVIIRFEIIDCLSTVKVKRRVTKRNGNRIETKATVETNGHLEFKCYLVNNNNEILHKINYPNYDHLRKTDNRTQELSFTSNHQKQIQEALDLSLRRTHDEIINNITKVTQDYLDEHFGYYTYEISFFIATGKGRKYDYNDLDTALDNFKSAAEIYSQNGLNDDVKSYLEESIAIWNKAAKEYKQSKKDTRITNKNIAYIYYNLSASYYLLEEYNLAREFNKKVIELGEKFSLIKQIDNREKAKNISLN